MTPTIRIPAGFRRTFAYLATVVFGQFASFVLLPIVTRFLAPDRYGEYAVALAVGGLIGMFGSSWTRNVAFRFYFDARSAGSTRSFFWSVQLLQTVVVTAIFAVVIAVFDLASVRLVTLPTLLALGAMTLVSDLSTWAVTLLRGEELTGRFALAETSAGVARIVGTAGGLLIGLRSPAFLLLAAAGAAAVEASIAVAALDRRLEGRSRISLSPLWQIVARAPSALPFSVGEWLNRLSDRLILSVLSTASVVGVYSAAQSMGNRLVAGLVQAVFMMAWPDVLNAYNEGGVQRARSAIRRYIQVFLTLSVGPVVALVLYAGTLIRLLGESYQGAVTVVVLIGAATWVSGFGSCFNRHYELDKRYRTLSGVTLAGAALNVALTFLLVPRLLGTGAALATLVAQSLVATAFVLLRDRELVDFPKADALYVLLAVAVPAAVAWPAFGSSVEGMIVFALGYLAIMGTVWARRMRRGRRVAPSAAGATERDAGHPG